VACLLQIFAHQHLATREDDKHIARVDIGCYLGVEDVEEILQRHISLRNIGTAVAATVTTAQITTKRTLPEECTQLMTLHNTVVETLEEFQTYVLAES
jgi:hypothetical protein